jgi:serine/threonine protein kinase
MDSEDYRHGYPDKFEDGDCVAQYDWQTSSFPTSNLLMEIDMTDLGLNAKGEDSLRLIANGFWRDVWRVRDQHSFVVLKTIRYEHDYEERNYDRHRRDAVAMERLTGSPYVMDIYAFTANSGLNEFADGGTIEDEIWYQDDDGEDWSPSQRLVIAHQLAFGLADAHNIGKEGVPAMAHADITTSQFVYVKEAGIYKLNDFNRCRFIRIDKKTNKTCPYTVGNNPGTVSISLWCVLQTDSIRQTHPLIIIISMPHFTVSIPGRICIFAANREGRCLFLG